MNIESAFQEFNNKRILVIGDVMIDAYKIGKVSRISPEAPVPIINLTKHEDRLGGAANVALNLVALGAQPIMCSVVGQDANGKLIENLLNDSMISSDGIVRSENRITTVKTRIIGNQQHLLRMDEEQTDEISSTEQGALLNVIQSLIETGVDGIIFEDYNKGVLTENLIQKVIELANKANVITTVDPKKDNFLAYKNVSLFKPNLKELKEGIGVDFTFQKIEGDFIDAVNRLENEINSATTMVTLSEHGVFIKDKTASHHCKAHIRNIADVSGAGDTVISVATLCLVVGMPIDLIAEVSNIAGGLVCERSGVVSIDKELLLKEVNKLLLA